MLRKNLREIGHFLGVQVDSELSPTMASFDSRKIEKGGLFFALEGTKHDGHHYLEEAALKGAVAAIVSKNYLGSDYGLILISVKDVRKSLQQLGCWVHREAPPYVLALTGTVGKTTTKEFTADLLEEKYRIAKTVGNANSQLSLPLFLLNQVDYVDMLVLEMGMSCPGDISHLIDIAPPDFGVLTKISLVHAENFENLNGIAEAKIELFQKTESGLFNLETMDFPATQKAALRKTFYSMIDPHADYFLKKKGDQVIIVEKGEESLPIALPFQAAHLLENFLCAAAIARMHGLTWKEIQKGAAKIKPYLHRFQIFERNGIQYIDDAYNASVASVKAALDNLPKGKKIIALLGDMLELGKFSVKCHEEVALYALDLVDHLLCIGNEVDPMVDIFIKAGKIAEKVSSIKEAKNRLQAIAQVGDVVLIKGSNSLQLWNVLD